MGAPLVNIGFGNLAAAGKIAAVISPEAAPIKRMVQEGRARGLVIDGTCGRKTRSVIFLEGGQILLSALHPETIAGRMALPETEQVRIDKEEREGEAETDE